MSRRGKDDSSKKKDADKQERRDKHVLRYIQESSEDKSSSWDIDVSAMESLTMEDILHLPIYREGRNAAGAGDKAVFQVRISGSLMRALERGYERSRYTFGRSKKPFDLWADYQRHALFTAALLMNMRFNEELGPEDLINLSEQEDLFEQEMIPELVERLKRSINSRKETAGKILFSKFMARIFNDTEAHIDIYMSVLEKSVYLRPWLDGWRKWQKTIDGEEVDDSVPEGDH